MPNATPAKNPTLAWILLVVIALFWGSSFILVKKSLGTFSVTEVATGRLFFASVWFLPVMLRTFRELPKRILPYLFTVGMLGYLIPAFLFSLAGTRLNSSLSGMLNSLSPLFTLLIGVLFFGQLKRNAQIVGILLGLVGSSLLIISGNDLSHLNLGNPYALLVLAATICYGININVTTKFLAGIPALTFTAWTFMIIGPVALAVLSTTDFFPKIVQPENRTSTLMLLTLGTLGSALSPYLFNKVLELSSGLFASSVTYLIPIVAIGWGVLDSETIGWQQFMGMAVILTGIYLVNRPAKTLTSALETHA
jgi:drug/metabolite transporter (DMT)-like permease